ncbi:MAG: putative Ig domain-containing protein, partial [Planctomycetes bacterium]|nr:putative Ig domain-containing protein [Planctomycetota bacterium]
MNRILAPLLLLALAATASAAATPDTGFGGTGVVAASLDDTNLTTAVVGCHVHSDDSLFLLIAAPDGMYVRNVEKGTGATRTLVWPSGQIRLAGIDPRHALYLARRASPPTNPSNQFRIVAGKPMLRVGPAVYRFNADGSRDGTYGLDGAIQAWQDFITNAESETGRIHLRSDGVVEAAVQRVVVTTGPVATCSHLMRRWDAEGATDTSFGTAGQATLALTSSYDFNDLQHMVSASDGTALVAQAPAPYRVLSDGSLDSGFRANAEAALTGIMVTPLAIVEDAVGQAATTGGKKYVVGKQMTGNWEVHLARLNADGTLDSSFATTLLWTTAGDPGLARIVVSSAGVYVLRAAEAIENNGIVTPSQTEVRRVLATGGIDSSFNGGLALAPTLSSAVIPFGVAVDGYGILSAFGAHNSPAAGVVARFDATGAPISAFATLGELTIAGLATNGADLPDFCIGLPDGRMLVAAQVLTDVVADDEFNASKQVLRRYTVAGALDPSFGSGGQLVTATDANQRAPSFEVMLNRGTGGVDGFLYDHFPAVYGSGQKDGIVWYNADGQVAFGVDGLISFPLDYRLDEMALVQSDGKLLVWGQYGSATMAGAVARITASGAFDSGFAGTGYASYPQVTDVMDMVRCQDGTYRLSGLLMSGTYPDQVAEARVVKLNADGSVDTGFGSGGVLVAGSGSANDAWHMAKVRWEDTGAFHYVIRGPATGAVTIGHMLASGLPDAGFGSGGMASHDLAIGTLPWQIDEFERSGDGKLTLTYAVDLGNRLTRNMVVRFTATGAIDTAYGTAGFIDLGTTRLPAPTLEGSNRALKADFWADGTLRVMRETWEHAFLLRPGESLGGLRCFDANGQPDTGIAAGGVLTVPGMTRVAYAWQSAGVLSVVGANDTPDLMVARFLTGPAAPAITSSTVASGTVGSAFSYTITASNTPTSYGASGLPAGLSVDAGTGLISGTPSASGSFPVTISATNANGTGSTTLTITVNAALPVATMALGPHPVIGGSAGVFIVNLSSPTATDLTIPLIISGTAVSGVDVSPLSTSVVVLSGSSVGNILVTALGGATAGRTITITIDAGAGFTLGAPASGTLTIQPAAPAITSPATAAAIKGSAFNYSITATSTPTSYNASGLPAGLSVNTATGLISGTPTVTGTFPVTISATNGSGTGNAVVTIAVAGAV